ncbi:imm11 family protein [Nostoc cycadae]|uniref:Immunity MXAN-0049 protein domain-containing protein n=1 Tax=Nostoc cycadae WK-1 TaxID=1861711 RepID=A0A2H6LDC2_9NOSO|nr:DUF1629 domain-containing protein [Nostoc cycadae]GBE91136.1 hypothetical protein NCWK1_0858 [Nostoc cycadae WK-1]
MNWYRPIIEADDYDGLVCINREDAVFVSNFNKDWYRYKKNVEWKTIIVETYSEEQVGDFPSFLAQELVFNERSWQIIQPLITNSVEPLPLICKDRTQYITIKILDLVDCLDYSQSVYRQSAGGFIQIDLYVFHEAMIASKDIFWLSKAYHAVVSQKFKDIVEENKLKGLSFRKLC